MCSVHYLQTCDMRLYFVTETLDELSPKRLATVPELEEPVEATRRPLSPFVIIVPPEESSYNFNV